MLIPELKTPLTEEINTLKRGDIVHLSGIIYTARDMAHMRMCDMMQNGTELPFSLKDQIVYYCGPAPTPPGMPCGAAGPTTSKRMDSLTPYLLDAGLKGMIGKGPRNDTVRRKIQRHRAIYLIAAGGCGALIAGHIMRCDVFAFKDLGPEAVYRMEVDKLPLVVGIDASGNDIYRR